MQRQFKSQVLMSHAQLQLNAFLANSNPNNAIINNNVILEKKTRDITNLKNTIRTRTIDRVNSNIICTMCRDTGVIEVDMYRGKVTRNQDLR